MLRFLLHILLTLLVAYCTIVFIEHGPKNFLPGFTSEWKNLGEFFNKFLSSENLASPED